MNQMYDYYFHFNIYTKEWIAFPRHKCREYANGELPQSETIRNKNINNIIKYISKK